MNRIIFCLMVCCLLILSACTIDPIKPWQRDVLARDNMAIDADSLIQLMDEQVYYSKEASSGGKGVGGGGCGCN